MKKIIEELISGIIIAAAYTFITLALVKSPDPIKFLVLYIGIEIISFVIFSIYGAVVIAIVSSFIATGVLIITGEWVAFLVILAYWVMVAVLNYGLEYVNISQGKNQLEIEDKEKEIGELITEREKNRRLIPILRDRIARYLKLANFSLELSTSFDIGKLYSFIMEYIRKFFPGNRVSLLNIPEDKYDRWVLKTQKPLIVENTEKDYRFKKNSKSKVISIIESCLFEKQEIIGAVKIESTDSYFKPADLRLLNVATTLSSIALEKAKLFQQIEELAVTDDLTRLYTHKYFKERLEEEVKRAARYNERFVVLMTDIDDFKHLNDTYSHQAGDIVLQEVAKVINDTVRETDVVGRYGGEEISVILNNINIKKARIIAERIRKAIENLEFQFEEMVKITITIGAASFPENPTSEELIRRADKALYTGKRKGKNRVVFAGEEEQ
ncbi:MAG: diguanylate cyclase [Elusimicrobiota bacterium]